MIYKFLKACFCLFLKTFNRFQVFGNENIPESGAVILVANHTSYWDPFVISAAISRKVCFVAKENLFTIPLVGMFISLWGAFPVRRGRSARIAIERSLEILNEGKVLGIFIEGTRNTKNPDLMLKPLPGPAMLAVKSKSIVIPIAIINARKILWGFKRLKIIFGKPMTFEDTKAYHKKDLYMQISNQITDEIMCLKKKKA